MRGQNHTHRHSNHGSRWHTTLSKRILTLTPVQKLLVVLNKVLINIFRLPIQKCAQGKGQFHYRMEKGLMQWIVRVCWSDRVQRAPFQANGSRKGNLPITVG